MSKHNISVNKYLQIHDINTLPRIYYKMNVLWQSPQFPKHSHHITTTHNIHTYTSAHQTHPHPYLYTPPSTHTLQGPKPKKYNHHTHPKTKISSKYSASQSVPRGQHGSKCHFHQDCNNLATLHSMVMKLGAYALPWDLLLMIRSPLSIWGLLGSYVAKGHFQENCYNLSILHSMTMRCMHIP